MATAKKTTSTAAKKTNKAATTDVATSAVRVPTSQAAPSSGRVPAEMPPMKPSPPARVFAAVFAWLTLAALIVGYLVPWSEHPLADIDPSLLPAGSPELPDVVTIFETPAEAPYHWGVASTVFLIFALRQRDMLGPRWRSLFPLLALASAFSVLVALRRHVVAAPDVDRLFGFWWAVVALGLALLTTIFAWRVKPGADD